MEDKRYHELRDAYMKKGGVAGNMYLRVFLVQAVLAVVISMPVIIVNASQDIALGYHVLIGIAIWLTGFFFEAVGDWQLRYHMNNPDNKGKLLTSGLWRYTRHPNYFGEVTQWWGIFVLVAVAPYWGLSLLGPLVVTILIVFFTGVPLAERHFIGRKGWEEYKKHTSRLIPLPPRRR